MKFKGDREVSGFREQNSCTRIIFDILQSLLHFLKARDLISCLKYQQPEQFPKGNYENKFQSSEKFCEHR